MKIYHMSRGLCVRLLVLLVIGLGLPLLTVTVAHTQDEAGSKGGPGTVLVHTPVDKQPGKVEAEMAESSAGGGDFEYDPWEPFNEKMFWFNREVVDRFVLKPAATAWDFVLPTPVQKGIHNVFDNLAVVRRVVNKTLQFKFSGAAKKAAPFTINNTIGGAGVFFICKKSFGNEENRPD